MAVEARFWTRPDGGRETRFLKTKPVTVGDRFFIEHSGETPDGSYRHSVSQTVVFEDLVRTVVWGEFTLGGRVHCSQRIYFSSGEAINRLGFEFAPPTYGDPFRPTTGVLHYTPTEQVTPAQ